MPKNFQDMMAQAGFTSKRADQPGVVREGWYPSFVRTGLGVGTSSDSPGSDQGGAEILLEEIERGRIQASAMKPDKSKSTFREAEDHPPDSTPERILPPPDLS
jgi:hypothetical protein